MTTRGAPTENTDFSTLANKKLIELKKKIALAGYSNLKKNQNYFTLS